METKHTPGPWHTGLGNGEGSVFADEGRMRLETGGTTLYPICSVIDYAGERDANARLIAAAPELLAVLQSYVDAWGEAYDNEDDINGGDAVEFLGGFVEDCRAAIAKATIEP